MNLVPLPTFECLPTMRQWAESFNYRCSGSIMVLDGTTIVRAMNAVIGRNDRLVLPVEMFNGQERADLVGENVLERLSFWKPEHGYYQTRLGAMRVSSTDVARPYRHGIRRDYLRVVGVNRGLQDEHSYAVLMQELLNNTDNFASTDEARESYDYLAVARHAAGNMSGVLLQGERRPIPWETAMADEDIVTDIYYEAGGETCLI